jgi:hypothetical protein
MRASVAQKYFKKSARCKPDGKHVVTGLTPERLFLPRDCCAVSAARPVCGGETYG